MEETATQEAVTTTQNDTLRSEQQTGGLPPETNSSLFGGSDESDNHLEPQTLAFSVPEEYKEKPWVRELLKNSDPNKELFKQYDHTLKMIGSRGPTVPGENATPQQIADYRKAIGIPDTPANYDIPATQWEEAEKPLGELIDKSRVPEILDAVKQSAYRNNIPPQALANLVSDFEKATLKYQAQEAQAALEKQKELDADFVQLGIKYFGDRYTEVLPNASDVLKKYVPENLRGILHSLDNKSLMIVAAVADNIHRRGKTEGTIPAVSSKLGEPGTLRERARELMKRPEFADQTSSTYKQVVELFKEIDRLKV